MPKEVKVGSELQNRYVVSRLLGDGGFGIVWQATDKQEGREVAIKRMKNLGGGELASLFAEAHKIKTLRGHKNIVEMYGTFVEDDEGFLVMEYVEGQSLQDIFQAHARARTWLSREEALDYFKQILDGLSFCVQRCFERKDPEYDLDETVHNRVVQAVGRREHHFIQLGFVFRPAVMPKVHRFQDERQSLDNLQTSKCDVTFPKRLDSVIDREPQFRKI